MSSALEFSKHLDMDVPSEVQELWRAAVAANGGENMYGIKKAYHQLALQLHPDKMGDADKFTELYNLRMAAIAAVNMSQAGATQGGHRNVVLKRARSADTFTFDELSAAVNEECTRKNLRLARNLLSELNKKKCDFKKWCFMVRVMTDEDLLGKTFRNLKRKRA